MLTHRHLGFRHLVAVAVLGGLIAAAPATARHDDRARYEIARLAHGLEVAIDQVRRQIHGDFYRDRGTGLLDRELAELQWQAGRFRQEVEHRGPGSRQARVQLDALLQDFYDAGWAMGRTPVARHARLDYERARYFMDTLIERYGGYRNFQHVRPSRNDHRVVPYGHGRWDDRRWDRDDRRRAYPRRY